MAKIWAVEVQGEESWGTTNESFEVSSLHASEDGARKRLEEVKLNLACRFLTNGELESYRLGPDTIMGCIYNDKVKDKFRTAIATPGMDFHTALYETAKTLSDNWTMEASMPEAQVRAIEIED